MSDNYHCEVITCVVMQLQAVAVARANSEDSLVRKRRHWIPPPKQLEENVDYTQEPVAKVSHSCFQVVFHYFINLIKRFQPARNCNRTYARKYKMY